jgi:glyoxylase-like metal-dependent hydrolase (beta-lactamase superfamily II)
VGGLVAGGAPAFPNAIVHADKRDADFWLSPATLANAPAQSKGFVQNAQDALGPYVAANRFQAFDGSAEIVPGVKALSTYGHTAGHTSYAVESRGQKLLVVGDLIHVGAVQFADPSVTIDFDMDGKSAAAARATVFTKAAKEGTLVGAAHLSFPGLGHLRAQGKSWQWLPLDYSSELK